MNEILIYIGIIYILSLVFSLVMTVLMYVIGEPLTAEKTLTIGVGWPVIIIKLIYKAFVRAIKW